MLAIRLPVGESVLWGRSRCPSCRTALAPWQLVPVLSWLLLRRRCAACGTALSVFYPAMELAALAVALWSSIALPDPLSIAAGCLLGWMLLVLAAIDWRHLLLPDILTLPLVVLGLAWRALDPAQAVADGAAGAVIGFSLLALVALLYRWLRGRDGLGLGDAKLFAAAGAWTGHEGIAGVLLVGSLAGLVVALALRIAGRHRGEPLPFGPPLAAAFWLVWLYGSPI